MPDRKMWFPMLLAVFVALIGTVRLSAQMWNGGHKGGHGGQCPMCGMPWDGSNGYTARIPDSLPKPDDEKWNSGLQDILARERLSKAQYTQDVEQYRLAMPYRMVIPQEDAHIEWIEDLFAAYGIEPGTEIPELIETQSPRAALETAMRLEKELIPDYEWLIKNAEAEDTKRVLRDILYQTRMHRTMFEHALSMGGR